MHGIEPQALRNHLLEHGWDNSKLSNQVPKRRQQMSEDVRKFVETSGGLNSSFRESMSASQMGGDSSIFNTICDTFGFTHHDGTDRAVELKVLRLILSRENMVMGLQHACEMHNAGSQMSKSKQKIRLFDMMTEVRDATVNLLHLISVWRTSSPTFDAEKPRPFIFKNENYVLRIVSDLNFMADCPYLLNATQLPREKMLNNPLMLRNTLFEAISTPNPLERALQDTNGVREGAWYEQRCKLRISEQLLLHELHFTFRENPDSFSESQQQRFVNNNGAYSELDAAENYGAMEAAMRDTGDDGPAQQSKSTGEGQGNRKGKTRGSSAGGSKAHTSDTIKRKGTGRSKSQDLYDLPEDKLNILSWSDQANVQLGRIASLRSEPLVSAGTDRLSPVTKVEEPEGGYKQQKRFHALTNETVSPTKLTALDTKNSTRDLEILKKANSPGSLAASTLMRSRSGAAESDGAFVDQFPPRSTSRLSNRSSSREGARSGSGRKSPPVGVNEGFVNDNLESQFQIVDGVMMDARGAGVVSGAAAAGAVQEEENPFNTNFTSKVFDGVDYEDLVGASKIRKVNRSAPKGALPKIAGRHGSSAPVMSAAEALEKKKATYRRKTEATQAEHSKEKNSAKKGMRKSADGKLSADTVNKNSKAKKLPAMKGGKSQSESVLVTSSVPAPATEVKVISAGGESIAFADEGRTNGGVMSSNFDGGKSIADMISKRDLQEIFDSNMDIPPTQDLLLAAAGVVILLSQDKEIPADISWGAFQELTALKDVPALISALNPMQVPAFKVRALLPFMKRLHRGLRFRVKSAVMPLASSSGSPFDYASASTEVSTPATRLIEWVIHVVEVANIRITELDLKNKLRNFTANAIPEKLKKPIVTKIDPMPQYTANIIQELVEKSANDSNPGSPNRSRVNSISDSPPNGKAAGARSPSPASSTHSSPAKRRVSPAKGAPVLVPKKKFNLDAKMAKSVNSLSRPTPAEIRIKDMPKPSLDMQTVFTDVTTDIYQRPLFLTLLAGWFVREASPINVPNVGSPDSKGDSPSRKKVKSPPPRAEPDRIVAKVYDPVTSREASREINMYDYIVYAQELEDKYPDGPIGDIPFHPWTIDWWIGFIPQIITVHDKADGTLKLCISKKLIEKIVYLEPAPYMGGANGLVPMSGNDYGDGNRGDDYGDYYDDVADDVNLEQTGLWNNGTNRNKKDDGVGGKRGYANLVDDDDDMAAVDEWERLDDVLANEGGNYFPGETENINGAMGSTVKINSVHSMNMYKTAAGAGNNGQQGGNNEELFGDDRDWEENNINYVGSPNSRGSSSQSNAAAPAPVTEPIPLTATVELQRAHSDPLIMTGGGNRMGKASSPPAGGTTSSRCGSAGPTVSRKDSGVAAGMGNAADNAASAAPDTGENENSETYGDDFDAGGASAPVSIVVEADSAAPETVEKPPISDLNRQDSALPFVADSHIELDSDHVATADVHFDGLLDVFGHRVRASASGGVQSGRSVSGASSTKSGSVTRNGSSGGNSGIRSVRSISNSSKAVSGNDLTALAEGSSGKPANVTGDNVKDAAESAEVANGGEEGAFEEEEYADDTEAVTPEMLMEKQAKSEELAGKKNKDLGVAADDYAHMMDYFGHGGPQLMTSESSRNLKVSAPAPIVTPLAAVTEAASGAPSTSMPATPAEEAAPTDPAGVDVAANGSTVEESYEDEFDEKSQTTPAGADENQTVPPPPKDHAENYEDEDFASTVSATEAPAEVTSSKNAEAVEQRDEAGGVEESVASVVSEPAPSGAVNGDSSGGGREASTSAVEDQNRSPAATQSSSSALLQNDEKSSSKLAGSPKVKPNSRGEDRPFDMMAYYGKKASMNSMPTK